MNIIKVYHENWNVTINKTMLQSLKSNSLLNISTKETKIRNVQKQPFKAVLTKVVLKICAKFTGERPCRSTISIKLKKQLYWNYTSTWLFSFKFAAYFQNTFSEAHLWRVASECLCWQIEYTSDLAIKCIATIYRVSNILRFNS